MSLPAKAISEGRRKNNPSYFVTVKIEEFSFQEIDLYRIKNPVAWLIGICALILKKYYIPLEVLTRVSS